MEVDGVLINSLSSVMVVDRTSSSDLLSDCSTSSFTQINRQSYHCTALVRLRRKGLSAGRPCYRFNWYDQTARRDIPVDFVDKNLSAHKMNTVPKKVR